MCIDRNLLGYESRETNAFAVLRNLYLVSGQNRKLACETYRVTGYLHLKPEGIRFCRYPSSVHDQLGRVWLSSGSSTFSPLLVLTPLVGCRVFVYRRCLLENVLCIDLDCRMSPSNGNNELALDGTCRDAPCENSVYTLNTRI